MIGSEQCCPLYTCVCVHNTRVHKYMCTQTHVYTPLPFEVQIESFTTLLRGIQLICPKFETDYIGKSLVFTSRGGGFDSLGTVSFALSPVTSILCNFSP